MLDTYAQCWKRVNERCPIAGTFLQQEWIQWAFRKIGETRSWTWLQKQSQIMVNNVYSTGTADAVTNSPSIQGTGTAWDGSLIGRQFRMGTSYPVYTIANVDDAAQVITLDDLWGGPTIVSGTYLIFNGYFNMPDDFHSFITVWDPAFNWQLWTNITQFELNMWDSQRASSGNAYVLSFRDYNPLTAASTPAVPRYELWPYQYSQKSYPYLYESRPKDLNDAGAALPRYIRGDVLVEGALWQAALWPGPSSTTPNPYFNLTLAKMHQANFERMVMELERQDDELSDQMVTYQSVYGLPYCTLPWADSRFLQSHAF